MKYKLRDYQEAGYNETIKLINSGVRSILYVLPTRAGKSGLISKLIETYSKDHSVYYLCHTKILLDQMSAELDDHGIRHGIISPAHPEIRYRVQVISKDTLRNRMDRMKQQNWNEPAIILIDEAHLAAAKTFRNIIDNYPDSIIIGVTATPIRLDGKPLGDIFDKMIIGPDVQELQDRGILCQVKNLAVQEFNAEGVKKTGGDYNSKDVLDRVDKPKIIKDIVEHWIKHAYMKKTMTFCVSIQHAEDIALEFRNRGFPSIAISSKDPKNIREKKLADYYAGKYINLCSVELFIMGMTIRECECIIQARPTQSLMIYMQTLGRGTMMSPGKDYLINLDCVNNWERHGKISDPRIWSLGGRQPKYISKLKRCPECLEPMLKTEKVCPVCGYTFNRLPEPRDRMPKEVEGEMVEIGSVNVEKQPGNYKAIHLIAKNAKSLKDAQEIAEKLGYKKGYGFYVWNKILKKGVA